MEHWYCEECGEEVPKGTACTCGATEPAKEPDPLPLPTTGVAGHMFE